jgi:adenylate cyclase
MKMYGFVPEFKAGVHVGVVTAVEVGEVKRNIAYHGDAINTAARIQSVCNKYNKEILVSGDLASLADFQNGFRLESLGGVLLKGKDVATEIFSVEKIEGLA